MKSKGNKSFALILVVLAILGLAYYVHLHERTITRQETTTMSDAEKLLTYDFENDYPKTVRETVKLHCEYLKNAYNGKFSDEELVIVNQNIRELFDDELLSINSESSQLQGMKMEIVSYNEKKQKFVSFSLPEGSQIQYNTENDKEYAKMTVALIINVGSSPVEVEQEYILRKDAEERWKILGWQTVHNADTSEEGES